MAAAPYEAACNSASHARTSHAVLCIHPFCIILNIYIRGGEHSKPNASARVYLNRLQDGGCAHAPSSPRCTRFHHRPISELPADLAHIPDISYVGSVCLEIASVLKLITADES